MDSILARLFDHDRNIAGDGNKIAVLVAWDQDENHSGLVGIPVALQTSAQSRMKIDFSHAPLHRVFGS